MEERVWWRKLCGGGKCVENVVQYFFIFLFFVLFIYIFYAIGEKKKEVHLHFSVL